MSDTHYYYQTDNKVLYLQWAGLLRKVVSFHCKLKLHCSLNSNHVYHLSIVLLYISTRIIVPDSLPYKWYRLSFLGWFPELNLCPCQIELHSHLYPNRNDRSASWLFGGISNHSDSGRCFLCFAAIHKSTLAFTSASFSDASHSQGPISTSVCTTCFSLDIYFYLFKISDYNYKYSNISVTKAR